MKRIPIKRLIKYTVITGAIVATLYVANYLRWTDDPRVEINKVYTVNGVSETYTSGVTEDNHHIAIELNEFGLTDLEVGDKLSVTIFVDQIVDVKEVK